MILTAAILPELPDLAHAIIGCVTFGGVFSLAAWIHKLRSTTPMPSQTDTDPPTSAAEHAMSMVRGGILREYKLLKSPAARMEFLHLIRAELTDLHALVSDELYKQREQLKHDSQTTT